MQHRFAYITYIAIMYVNTCRHKCICNARKRLLREIPRRMTFVSRSYLNFSLRYGLRSFRFPEAARDSLPATDDTQSGTHCSAFTPWTSHVSFRERRCVRLKMKRRATSSIEHWKLLKAETVICLWDRLILHYFEESIDFLSNWNPRFKARFRFRFVRVRKKLNEP